jgi:hypothetical protein
VHWQTKILIKIKIIKRVLSANNQVSHTQGC